MPKCGGVTSSRPLHLSTFFMCISFANFLFFIPFMFVYLQCQSQTTWTRYTDKMSGKMTTFIFTKYGIRHTVGYKAQIDDAAKMLRKEYGNVKILFAKYLEL